MINHTNEILAQNLEKAECILKDAICFVHLFFCKGLLIYRV